MAGETKEPLCLYNFVPFIALNRQDVVCIPFSANVVCFVFLNKNNLPFILLSKAVKHPLPLMQSTHL